MNHPSMIRKGLIAAGLIVAFAAIPVGGALAQDSGSMSNNHMSSQTVPDKAADAWITTKVKTEFGTTKGIDATDISVTTKDGVVMLSGTTATRTEKMHAVRVAKAVKGVKRVEAAELKVTAAK